MTRHLTTPDEYKTKAMLNQQDANAGVLAREKASGVAAGYLEFKNRVGGLSLALYRGKNPQRTREEG